MLITSRLGLFAQKKASSRRQSMEGVTHMAQFGSWKSMIAAIGQEVHGVAHFAALLLLVLQ